MAKNAKKSHFKAHVQKKSENLLAILRKTVNFASLKKQTTQTIMLQQFILENFLSFRDRQVFTLQPGKGSKMNEHRVQATTGQWIVKTSAIFGANASGKSNLVVAMALSRHLVLFGTPAETLIDYFPFRLSSKTKKKDTTFTYHILCNNKKYEYGFSYNAKQINKEWLKLITRRTEHIIFDRDTRKGNFDVSYLQRLNPKEEEKQFLAFFAKSTPLRQLFLHEVIDRDLHKKVSNAEDLWEVAKWFIYNFKVLFPDTPYKQGRMLKAVNDGQLKKHFGELLKYFDTSIEGVDLIDVDFDKLGLPNDLKKIILRDMSTSNSKKEYGALKNDKNLFLITFADGKINAKKLQTLHKKIDENDSEYFSLVEESDGTQRIIDYIPLVLDLIQGGKVFVIDEMERSLHPLLMRKLLNLFLCYSDKLSSQLIFTTHESTLMDQNLLRRDEIWLMDKAKDEVSNIERLDKKFRLRFDKSLEKEYLKGSFGAVPNFENEDIIKSLRQQLK